MVYVSLRGRISKRVKHLCFGFCGGALFLGLSFLGESGAQLPPQALPPEIESSNSTDSPLVLDLAFSTPPSIRGVSTLMVTILSLVDAPNTSVEIDLPAGIELISGGISWQGDLTANRPVTLALEVLTSQPGDWTISALASSQISAGYTLAQAAHLTLSVQPEGVVIQESGPDRDPGSGPESEFTLLSSAPTEVEPLHEAPMVASKQESSEPLAQTTAEGQIVVFGYVYYEDQSGVKRPLPYARVNIWDDDDFGDDLLAQTFTLTNGYYQALVENSDGTGNVDIYIQVAATDDFSVRVMDMDWNLYYIQTDTDPEVPDGPYPVGEILIDDPNTRAAWYMFDILANQAWNYFYYQVGWVNSYNLLIRWEPGVADGTSFYRQSDQIVMQPGDEWDVDVLLHEYGHFVMDHIYADYPDTPDCDPHYIGVHSSEGCAWSEGWAHFVSAAIQHDPIYTNVVSTTYTSTVNFENPSSTYHHIFDEGAVAAVLWDIFDDSGLTEPHDLLADGLNGTSGGGIWDIVFNQNPDTVLEFYTAWREYSGNNSCEVANILADRSISVVSPCPTQVGWVDASDGTSTSSILIDWENTGASSYKIYKGISSGGTYDHIATVSSVGYSDSQSLAPYAAYYYRVQPCDNATGCTLLSPFDTGYNKLPDPTGVSASDGDSTSEITVTWNAVDGANSYNVWRAYSVTGPMSKLGSTATLVWTDYDPAPFQTAYYWIEACLTTTLGCSLSTYDTGWRDMSPPVFWVVTQNRTDKIDISWWDVTDASEYELYRAEFFTGPRTKLTTTAGTNYSDFSAAAGPDYYYWLKACNTFGCSDFSAHASGQRDLGPPTNVQASDGSPDDLVRVTWDSFPGATYYQVWRAENEEGTKTLIGSPNTTAYDNTGISYGVTYYYWIKACNPDTCSEFSDYDTGGVPPLIPTTVAATDGTYTTKVRVTWNGQLGASEYQVYRSDSLGGSKTLLGSPASNSYDDSTAVFGTTYYYWVKACNPYGCRDYSDYDTGWQAAAVPQNVQASDGAYLDKVQLTWDDTFSATSYNVYWWTSATPPGALLGTTASNSYDDATIGYGDPRYYWVVACNDSGCGDHSASDSGFRIMPPPVNLAAEAGTIYEIKLTWDEVPGGYIHEIYRATGSSTAPKTLIDTIGNISTYWDASMEPGLTHYYWVKACNDTVCSDFGDYVAYGTPPLAPDDVTATDGTRVDLVKVDWSAVPGATSYEIYRADSLNGAKTQLVPDGGTDHNDWTAIIGLTYHYWVKACNPYGCSLYSAPDTGWQGAGTLPSGIQASDGTYSDKIRISWDAYSGASIYEVYRADDYNGTKVFQGYATDPWYNDTQNLTPGEDYWYWVKVCGPFLCGDYSSRDDGWRKMPAPTNIQASDGTFSDKVYITWDGVAEAENYKVYAATSLNGTKSEVAGSAAPATEAYHLSAQEGVTYFYFVTAYNGLSTSDYSQEDIGGIPPAKPQTPLIFDETSALVTISWYRPGDASLDYFEVWRAPSQYGEKTLLGTTTTAPNTSAQYADYTGIPLQGNYYSVRACALFGCGEFSNHVVGTRKMEDIAAVQASDGAYTDSIKITWSTVPSATLYEVSRRENSEDPWSLLATSPITSHIDISPTIPGYYYDYSVVPCNQYGCHDFGTTDQGMREMPPPSSLDASDGLYPGEVRVQWGSIYVVDYYHIYRADPPGGILNYLDYTTPDTLTYSDTTAQSGVIYEYAVVGDNHYTTGIPQSRDAGWLQVTTPANLQASDGAYTDKVSLSWDASPGASFYQVYRAESQTGLKTLVYTPTLTTADDISATSGMTYTYWIKACLEEMCSSFSAVDSGYRALAVPSNLGATDGTETTGILLSWDPSADAARYDLYRAESTDGPKTLITATLSTAYTDTTIIPGMSYFYWVQGCNSYRCSADSSSDSGWGTAPEPIGVEASEGSYTETLHIAWRSVPGMTYYEVWGTLGTLSSESTLQSTSLLTTTIQLYYDDPSTPVGVTYTYQIKSCNTYTCSDFSLAASGYRGMPVPGNLSALEGPGSIALTWDPVAEADSYQVWWSGSSDGVKTLLDTVAVPSYQDPTPGDFNNYYWVKACNEIVCSAYSQVAPVEKSWVFLPLVIR